jgi:signal transduction histidine kinase
LTSQVVLSVAQATNVPVEVESSLAVELELVPGAELEVETRIGGQPVRAHVRVYDCDGRLYTSQSRASSRLNIRKCVTRSRGTSMVGMYQAAPNSGGRSACRSAFTRSTVPTMLKIQTRGSATDHLERRATIHREALEGTGAVGIGADALRQILLNLVLNALEVSPEGGRVVLSAVGDRDSIALAVEDEGPGVAPELRALVLEPFFSTRGQDAPSSRPGGLGLAISRRIAIEVGGRLEVGDSVLGGACFRVILPRA